MDDETAELILSFQIFDLEAALDRCYGKRPSNTAPSDNELALKDQLIEVQNTRTHLSDLRMVQSIKRAEIDNFGIITILTAQENAASQDRAMALRLGGVEVPATPISRIASPSLPHIDDACQDLAIVPLDTDTMTVVSFEDNLEIRNQQNIETCVFCMDQKYTLLTPCGKGHHWCVPCLRGLFEQSLKDESLFPPRCCQIEIAPSTIWAFLSREVSRRFAERQIEMSISDRTYCRSCTKFILPDQFSGRDGICPACPTRTCSGCKDVAHEDVCPDDPALEATKRLAEENGWRACPKCHSMVELAQGCYHITCNCRAEWCYLCGVPWKKCRCVRWDEDLLQGRANVIANRPNARNQGYAGPARAPAREVQRIAELVRERHECTHTSWKSFGGEHQCEVCDKTMPQFIYECRLCMLQACRRCKLNRV